MSKTSADVESEVETTVCANSSMDIEEVSFDVEALEDQQSISDEHNYFSSLKLLPTSSTTEQSFSTSQLPGLTVCSYEETPMRRPSSPLNKTVPQKTRLKAMDPFSPDTSYSARDETQLCQSNNELLIRFDLTSIGNDLNDSTDLVHQFKKFKLETPGKVETPIYNPRPDVLSLAIEQKTINDLKEKIKSLEQTIEEKDSTIDGLKQQLNKTTEENLKYKTLTNSLDHINQELVVICGSIREEKERAFQELNAIERSFSDLHSIYDKLRNELTLTKESESSSRRQCLTTIEKNQELEKMYKELREKFSQQEKQCSMNEKKEFENELIAARVQYKKAEMRISSLQNQLTQKSMENNELSSMVDELILKVQK